MEIAKREKDGVMVVSLVGRLDAASAGDTEAELNALTGEGRRLLIDLQGLEYISSAGLRVLLVVAKQIRKINGKMCLCSLTETVREVFEISGFSAIFDIADSEEDAFEILK